MWSAKDYAMHAVKDQFIVSEDNRNFMSWILSGLILDVPHFTDALNHQAMVL